MKPEDVPETLMETLRETELPAPRLFDDGEAWARWILAAVLPAHEKQVRERLAEEIEGNQGPFDPGDDHDRGVLTAIAIIHGEIVPRPETDVCRSYDDGHGSTVRVAGGQPLTAEGQAALREVVGAVRRRHAEEKAAERAEIERQVREQVAQEIDRVADEEDDGSSWGSGMLRAVQIARGGS